MTQAEKSQTDGWAERVERLARLVPGVGPYQDREGLRETDKRVRTYLGELLGGLARDLEPAQRLLSEAGRLDRLPAVDRVVRVLNTVADRIRYASYGFAGVFDLHKIRERELTSLHEFDVRLMESVPRLQDRVRALTAASERVEWFDQAARAAESALRDFERTLDERDRIARGL
jgi:hypothetical protein